MASPRLGKDGAIYLSTDVISTDLATRAIAHITDWELAVNQDALEKTAFGDGFQRTYTAGLRGPVATFNGYFGETDAQQGWFTNQITTTIPRSVGIALITVNTLGSKQGWRGSAFANVTLGAAQDGVQTISGTLTFNGGLDTYSTVAT